MADDVILNVFEFFDEFLSAGSYLVDVLADFLSRHADAIVNHLQGLFLFIEFDLNLQS